MRFFCFCLLLLVACSKKKPVSSLENEDLAKIAHLYKPIAKPNKHDWLSLHQEKNQSFADFQETNSGKAESIQFLIAGKLSNQDSALVKKIKGYLSVFYNLEIGETRQLTIESIPDSLLRNRKLQSTSFLEFLQNETLIQKELGVLNLVICKSDLQPFPNANSIFGQASKNKKLALVSLFQIGKMENEIPNQKLQELRGIKIASHEVGHLLGLSHCQTFQCNINGVNHLRELDGKPVQLCPYCLEKVGWRQKLEHNNRFEELGTFWTPQNKALHTHYGLLKKAF
jgi:archaemetzincin